MPPLELVVFWLAIRSPSGDHTGHTTSSDPSAPREITRVRLLVPSGAITWIPCVSEKAIIDPSGDHAGYIPSASLARPVPSTFIVQMTALSETTNLVPSGDREAPHRGSRSTDPIPSPALAGTVPTIAPSRSTKAIPSV